MADWKQFDPQDMYPTEVADLVNGLATVTDTLGTSLGVLATGVDFASTFISDVVSVDQLLIEAAQKLITDAFQQMMGTGIYWLHHMSPSVSHTLPPSQWLQAVANSLYDRMDERAPILEDPSAFVGGIAIVGTSENLNDLFQDFNRLLQFLGIYLSKMGGVGRWPELGDDFLVVPGIGRAPNWNSKKVVDIIPGLGDLAEQMIGFSNMLSGPTAAGSLYDTFSALLRAKASKLSGIASVITTVLDTISLILNFDGAFILPIYGQGDKDWVASQLLNSTGGPLDQEDANYTVGALFLATGGTTGPRDVLFDLFGQVKEDTA